MKTPEFPVPVKSLDSLGPGAYLLTLDYSGPFIPGQVTNLALSSPGHSRLYSLCQGPGEPWQILFTLTPEGQLTPGLVHLKAGDPVWISQAFGAFRTQSPSQEVWIANGTGISPFRAFLRAGHRPAALVHGGRSRDSFYFFEEFSAALGVGFIPCSSLPEAPKGCYPGRLTRKLRDTSWAPGTQFLLCGSAAMVVEVRDILISQGFSYDGIQAEIYF